MRLAGYVREAALAADAEPAFAQSERIRRWAEEQSADLVAVCRDTARPGDATPVTGLAALLAMLDAGVVDTVVVASMQALAADSVGAEIVQWEIERRNVPLHSVADDLHGTGATRGVLERLDEHRRRLSQA